MRRARQDDATVEILSDGRTARLAVRGEPGLPDWTAGYRDGARLDDDRGVGWTPIGAEHHTWTMARPDDVAVPNRSARVERPFFARVCFADAAGVDVEQSADGGAWPSDAPRWPYQPPEPGQALRLSFPKPVPPGRTGRVYVREELGGPWRRLAEDLPAGTRHFDVRSVAGGRAVEPSPCHVWVLKAVAAAGRAVRFGERVAFRAGAGLLSGAGAIGPLVARNHSVVELPVDEAAAVHVSAGGDDRGDGSPRRPVRTLARAVELLAARRGRAIRLRRGDVFADVFPPLDAARHLETLVIEPYGPGEARPRLERPPGLSPNQGLFRLSEVSYTRFVMRGIEVRGLWVQAPASPLQAVIQDCVLDNAMVVMSRQFGRRGLLVGALVDSVVRDCRSDGPHVQGLFSNATESMLVSGCVFDRNGYPSLDFSRADMFCHGMYLQYRTTEATVWGNLVSRSGSHGLQLRHVGTVALNHFDRNALGLMVGFGGCAARNLLTRCRDISEKLPRGIAVTVGGETSVEGNVVLDPEARRAPRAFDLLDVKALRFRDNVAGGRRGGGGGDGAARGTGGRLTRSVLSGRLRRIDPSQLVDCVHDEAGALRSGVAYDGWDAALEQYRDGSRRPDPVAALDAALVGVAGANAGRAGDLVDTIRAEGRRFPCEG